MSILNLIASRNFICVNKDLVHRIGLHGAIIIGELASMSSFCTKNGQLPEDGFFFATIESIQKNTGLARRGQDTALKELKEQGIIEISIRGLPARRFFRINEKKLAELLSIEFVRNEQYSLYETDKLLCAKRTGNNNRYTIIENNNKENIIKEKNTLPEDCVAAEPLPAPDVAESVFSFESFWSAYEKKCERSICENIYAKIPEKDRKIIKEHVFKYVAATPVRTYRKNPATYLRKKCWQDEIITPGVETKYQGVF